jgi:hypothetical protein
MERNNALDGVLSRVYAQGTGSPTRVLHAREVLLSAQWVADEKAFKLLFAAEGAEPKCHKQRRLGECLVAGLWKA